MAVSNELKSFAARLPVPLYAVGGCVRDALLGKVSHDMDLCSALRPDEMRRYAHEAGYDCPVVNERLGTVLLCIGDERYEHTTFRTESYPQGGAHAPESIAFTDSIRADALRRDFSINALYRDVLTNELVDPTGGMRDLERRVLRTTTVDPTVILQDDGLRILRLVRFAVTTGFAVEEATWDAAKTHAALLNDIAWERRRQELDRILETDDVLLALHLLTELHVWPYLIPEICEAANVPQRPEYHRYDVQEHLFHSAAMAEPDATHRLMALLHDIGKPRCLLETGDFHRHAVYGEQMTLTILRRLTYPKAFAARVATAVRMHMFDLDGRAKESTIRKRFVMLGRQGTEDLIALREADIRGSGYETEYAATRWRTVYEQMQWDGCPWSVDELDITGREIMETLQIPPSAAVSEIKRQLLLHCACHPQDNRNAKLQICVKDYAIRTNKCDSKRNKV